MIKSTGAEIVVRLLERQGIELITGIPGGANLPIYDALSQSSKIRHVLARHEQGAGFIAQGMARVIGQPQVCFATSGPGAMNVLTAIADAKLDSVPVVCITGQVPASMIGTDAFQEVDTYGLSIPITKHNFLVRSAEELLEVIPRAFNIAASGRPGPVLIDIPKDVQTAEVEFESWPEPGLPESKPELDIQSLERAAEMINKAKRPMLYLGGGVINADAGQVAAALAEKCSIPVAVTLMGLGALPTEHQLYLGMLGMHAARYTNMAVEECDLLIAAGVRFDDRATGKVEQFCPKAGVIHIDIDPSELGKIKCTSEGIAGDIRQALEALLPIVDDNPRAEWLGRINELKSKNPLIMPGVDDPQTPYGVILKVAELLDDSAIIATDVGQHQMRTAQAYPFSRPRQMLTSGGLGTMGFGMPTAIGAAFAEPDRTVVCFSGDGSLMMNIQEMATAVEEGANIKIVLLNNMSLGLVHQQQDMFYGKRYFATKYKSAVDFMSIAKGFGMKAYDLAEGGNPEDILAKALGESGPCLIQVRVDVEESVYPMVPPGAANNMMIGGEANAS